MKRYDRSANSATRSQRRVLSWIVVGALALGVLAVMPGAWALPEQKPGFQTVPTLTPTPTPRGATATPTRPGQPTSTPVPGATSTPTDTPGAPTATLVAATPTATVALTPGASATATQAGTAGLPAAPGNCWTSPTPGFAPVRWEALQFEATSDQSLVVPGQTVVLYLEATNLGADAVDNVLICNPLPSALQRGEPVVSQGEATLTAEGLIVEVGDLEPGISATAKLSLTIPIDYPLGGVIEDQAWLFSQGQQASTSLLTWALPPAYLPPTGK